MNEKDTEKKAGEVRSEAISENELKAVAAGCGGGGYSPARCGRGYTYQSGYIR